MWNVTGDRLLSRVEGVRLRTRRAQCGDFAGLRRRLAALSRLRVTHFRFALDWAAIVPTGRPDGASRAALRYYRCVISEGLKLRLAPMVTLYHPTQERPGLPEPLLRDGGWLNPATVRAFEDYAALCFGALGDLVKLWITINEPNRLSDAYGRAGSDAFRAAHHLLLAHARAWRLYDRQFRRAQRGALSLALHADWAEPANPYAPAHAEAAERFRQLELAWFADPLFRGGDYPPALRDHVTLSEHERSLVRGAADFCALNHFTTRFVLPAGPALAPAARDAHAQFQFLQDVTCLSSPSRLAVLPWGLRRLLRWVRRRYGDVDVYVTAGGVDDPAPRDDRLRQHYLQTYVQEALKGALRSTPQAPKSLDFVGFGFGSHTWQCSCSWRRGSKGCQGCNPDLSWLIHQHAKQTSCHCAISL